MRDYNNSRQGGGRRFDRGDRQMHDAVCSDCGADCQVPFMPSGQKPVRCNDCFRGNDDRSSRGSSRSNRGPDFQAKFDEINAKLDRVVGIVESLAATHSSDSEAEVDAE